VVPFIWYGFDSGGIPHETPNPGIWTMIWSIGSMGWNVEIHIFILKMNGMECGNPKNWEFNLFSDETISSHHPNFTARAMSSAWIRLKGTLMVDCGKIVSLFPPVFVGPRKIHITSYYMIKSTT
jgi:hypothetical protein